MSEYESACLSALLFQLKLFFSPNGWCGVSLRCWIVCTKSRHRDVKSYVWVHACQSFLLHLHFFLKCWLLLFSPHCWPFCSSQQGGGFQQQCIHLYLKIHGDTKRTFLTQTNTTWNNNHVMPVSRWKIESTSQECARGSSLCQSIETNQYTQGLYWATSTGARVCVTVCKRLCGQEREVVRCDSGYTGGGRGRDCRRLDTGLICEHSSALMIVSICWRSREGHDMLSPFGLPWS